MLEAALLPPSRARQVTGNSVGEEITKPSPFDLPDSFLISLFSFSFLKIPNKKRYQIIGNGIGTFIALVFYQHAIYDLLWVSTFSTSWAPIIYNFCLLFGSVLCLVLSRSLESLIQYEPLDSLQNDLIDLINSTNYLCGYIDSDLQSCCGRPCWFSVGPYHIYPLRIIRYNINAILISACWVGNDSLFELFTQRILSHRNATRLGVDLFLLIISNLLLLYCGQLSGQMGVFNNEHAVETLPPPTVLTVSEEGPPPPPLAVSTETPPVLPDESPTPSPPSAMMALSTSQPAQGREEQDVSIDGWRFTERESSIIERGTQEMSLHFKVTLTLAGVLVYWFSLWDLLWNIPREAVVKAAYDSRDDDMDDVESYSRRHVSPRVEIYLMLIGLFYCLISALVLILTGGLYSFVNKDTDETHAVRPLLLLSPVSH
jgi:hypothetical protein